MAVGHRAIQDVGVDDVDGGVPRANALIWSNTSANWMFICRCDVPDVRSAQDVGHGDESILAAAHWLVFVHIDGRHAGPPGRQRGSELQKPSVSQTPPVPAPLPDDTRWIAMASTLIGLPLAGMPLTSATCLAELSTVCRNVAIVSPTVSG